jgi:hypothetical protein
MPVYTIRFGHTEKPCGTEKNQTVCSSHLATFLKPGNCFQSGELNLESISKIDSINQFGILTSLPAGAGNFSEMSCRSTLSGGYDPASNTAQFNVSAIGRHDVFY